MSLINDALKRAKQVQDQSPPAAGQSLQLRPVEPEEKIRRGLGYLIPVSLAIVALLALFFVWQMYQRQNQGTGPASSAPPELVVHATTAPPAPPVPEVVLPPVVAPVPGPAEPKPAAPLPAPAVAPAPVPAAIPLPVTNPPVAAVAQAADATVSNALAELLPPKPPPLKLQLIVYNPSRPSAAISGRVVFLGDRVGELKVTSITADSVTLSGAGKTNVLSLSD